MSTVSSVQSIVSHTFTRSEFLILRAIILKWTSPQGGSHFKLSFAQVRDSFRLDFVSCPKLSNAEMCATLEALQQKGLIEFEPISKTRYRIHIPTLRYLG